MRLETGTLLPYFEPFCLPVGEDGTVVGEKRQIIKGPLEMLLFTDRQASDGSLQQASTRFQAEKITQLLLSL